MSKHRDVDAPAGDAIRVGLYVDASGNRTRDPSKAVRGEILEHEGDGRASRRTWFRLDEVKVTWLPVSESAFLLWVLALLVFAWLVIGLLLLLL